MATTQTFETIIKLNSQEAKNQLEQLRKKVDGLKAARDKAIQSKADSCFIKDISGSTIRDLEFSLKLVNEQLRDTKQGTEEYDKLVDSAKQLKTQIHRAGGGDERGLQETQHTHLAHRAELARRGCRSPRHSKEIAMVYCVLDGKVAIRPPPTR